MPSEGGAQRDVAGRVVAGASSTEVADALVVSRRTVENHLQRVYDYLGVHSRAELAATLTPRGATRSVP